MGAEGAGYLLDFLIEPVASVIESLFGISHEAAVTYAKWVVYPISALIIIVIILAIIRAFRGR